MNQVSKIYKNAYSGLSPATWWLSLVMLINRSGTMVIPFMTLYLTQSRHYKISQAGIVMAIFGMGAICGGFLGGKLTDKFGFYNIQLTALLSGGTMFLILGQMTSFPAICCAAFFLALLNDSFRPANATAIAQYSNDHNRTRCFSLNRLSINLGFTIGSAIGGLIASRNYQLLFWIDGLTNIGAALLLRAVLAPQRNKQTPSLKDRKEPPKGGRLPYGDRAYLFFILLTVLFALCFFQMFTTVPIYFRVKLLLTPFMIGAVMALNGMIIALVEMALVFHLERHNRNLDFITVGVLLTALSFVTYNLLPGTSSVALTAILIVTAGEMLSMPFMNTFMISRTNAGNRGQYAGLYTAGWSIAQVIGPYSGTLIVERFGFSTLWWAIGIVGVMAAIGFQWLKRKTLRGA